MNTNSLGKIAVIMTAVFLLLLRELILSIGKRRKDEAHARDNTSGDYRLEIVRNQGESENHVEASKASIETRIKRTNPIIAVVFMLSCGVFIEAHAQQTIFNVPSSDVLPKGKVYGELDITWKPNDSADNVVRRFSSFVPRIVVGAGSDFEIGLNVNGNIQPGPDATTLVPAIKWRIYNGKDNGWLVVVGDHVFIPVRNNAYDAGNYVYAQVSRAFNGGRTRLTAGGYDFSPNVVASNAHRAGGQFGFEHAVNSKFTVQADWFTGKHASGYFTPGFYIKPHPKVTVYGGYSIGNADFSKGNHFFYTAIGFNFN